LVGTPSPWLRYAGGVEKRLAVVTGRLRALLERPPHADEGVRHFLRKDAWWLIGEVERRDANAEHFAQCHQQELSKADTYRKLLVRVRQACDEGDGTRDGIDLSEVMPDIDAALNR
jgi:hypothetical protein